MSSLVDQYLKFLGPEKTEALVILYEKCRANDGNVSYNDMHIDRRILDGLSELRLPDGKKAVNELRKDSERIFRIREESIEEIGELTRVYRIQ